MTPPLPEIPVSDEPSPTNFCAVTIPVYVACPFVSIVTPVPTWIPLAVVSNFSSPEKYNFTPALPVPSKSDS